MKKLNFLGTVRVHFGFTSKLIYGYWEWHEELNGWLCNGELYGNNEVCEKL